MHVQGLYSTFHKYEKLLNGKFEKTSYLNYYYIIIIYYYIIIILLKLSQNIEKTFPRNWETHVEMDLPPSPFLEFHLPQRGLPTMMYELFDLRETDSNELEV